MIVHNQLSCKLLVAEYRHWLAAAKLVNHRWVTIWASELPENTDILFYTATDFSWCWRRNKDSFQSSRGISCFLCKFWDFSYSDLVCAPSQYTHFSVSHLPGQLLQRAVADSILLFIPGNVTNLLLKPRSAFQGSGAAAEIPFHNLWYPFVASLCTNNIAWGFAYWACWDTKSRDYGLPCGSDSSSDCK